MDGFFKGPTNFTLPQHFAHALQLIPIMSIGIHQDTFQQLRRGMTQVQTQFHRKFLRVGLARIQGISQRNCRTSSESGWGFKLVNAIGHMWEMQPAI